MERIPYKIYAEDVNHNTFVETDVNISFVYLHGSIYTENIMDLVATRKEDNAEPDLHLEDDVYIVTIVFPNGKEEECYMYYWHDKSEIDYADLLFYKAPIHHKLSCQHGLICRIGDDKANEYACEKFNERANHL